MCFLFSCSVRSCWFRHFQCLAWLVFLGIGVTPQAGAVSVSLPVVHDTFITAHAGLGGSGANHGSRGDMWLIRGCCASTRAYPLLQFDLSAYAGASVDGATAQLQFEIIGGFGSAIQSVSVRELIVGWDEHTVTLANFAGSGFQPSAHTGPNLMTQTITYGGGQHPVTFTLPASLIQGWIDNPMSNLGLVLFSNTSANSQDIIIATQDNASYPAASLLFDVTPVPIPAALMLFGSGLLVLTKLSRPKSVPCTSS